MTQAGIQSSVFSTWFDDSKMSAVAIAPSPMKRAPRAAMLSDVSMLSPLFVVVRII